ncbi:hypothetical protein [Nocardia yamanashiensis]|uniref:hypothetical protein n=1 Tax=Nocardia yamanashiensis TaxID=209247 RepID=UPI00082DA5AE|nr:hypothetical protein [Nocardia yamanashiensis]
MNAPFFSRAATVLAGIAISLAVPGLATAAEVGDAAAPPTDAGSSQTVLPQLGSGSAALGTGSSTAGGVAGALGTGSAAAGSVGSLIPGPGSVLGLLGTGSGAASGSAQAGGTLASALGTGSAAAGSGSAGAK